MSTNDPFKPKQRRRQARLERLGAADPACVVCGESDDRVLQRHHLAGQAYGEELVLVCANCHHKLSDAQADHPADGPAPPFLVRLAHYLLGLADLAAEVAARLRDYALELLRAAEGCPQPWGLVQAGDAS